MGNQGERQMRVTMSLGNQPSTVQLGGRPLVQPERALHNLHNESGRLSHGKSPYYLPLFFGAQHVKSAKTSALSTTAQKLKQLRALMSSQKLDAYLIPSADEHINEYLPKHLNRREWASGFTGSAGDFLVTTDTAWLFVDGRYHEQADKEVDLKSVHISKLGKKGQPTLIEKLKTLAQEKQGLRVGYDPFTLTAAQYKQYEAQLAPWGATLAPVKRNLVDKLWKQDRPAPLNAPTGVISDKAAGKTVAEKLKDIRKAMKDQNAEVLPVTKLDQIGWLYNLHGQDIPYNPLFLSYAIVTPESAYLFTEPSRVDDQARKALKGLVEIRPYDAYATLMKGLSTGRNVLIDPAHNTQGTVRLVKNAKGKIISDKTPIEMMKAVKNDQEIEGMKQAHLRASVALVRVWKWVEDQRAAGNAITEKSFADQLEAFYAADPAYRGLSFNTIPGAGANGSIIHYGTPDPKKKLEDGELFLFDSGAQYLTDEWGGTTDTTRTIGVGQKPTNMQINRYTAVLKAHISCARQIFPRGVTGAQLDGITRQELWSEGLDFLHGTGHGVGMYRNVHEGPNGISSRAVTPFEPGMVTSIEPGYYKKGWGGIRLENLYYVTEREQKLDTTGEKMLGFEPLIFVPMDKALIDKDALSNEQLAWLKNYNTQVLQKLTPLLEADEVRWLKDKCKL